MMQMRPWFGKEEKKAVCEYMDEDGFITEFKRTKKFEEMIARELAKPPKYITHILKNPKKCNPQVDYVISGLLN